MRQGGTRRIWRRGGSSCVFGTSILCVLIGAALARLPGAGGQEVKVEPAVPTATPSAVPATTPAATPPAAPATTPAAAPAPAGAPQVPVPIGPDGKPVLPTGTVPGDPNAKPGDSPVPDAPPTAITRPTTPPVPPNREEFNLKLDADGKVRFNFRGQPWTDVVTWLADISQMSLDWQELPADYLNLTTQRGYTVDEARDLVNRHLLARGYTLLANDEVLNVVNLKKLDPALVPRVAPEELAKRMPHEFVKVSFPLDWLVAESAVEELTPMMSPHGKLTALKSTNRLEAMDAVVNLRSLHKVLGDEQSPEGQERLVREFELEFAKATEVQRQLQKLLGLEENNATANGRGLAGMNPEQLQRLMQQQMEMMRQQEGGGRGRGGPPASKQKPDVSLVVNERRNSILALAPPDKMAVVAQAVKMLDVAPERTPTLMGSLQRMQVYRLAALDPATVVKLLEESGGLDPTTRVQADEKNKAIVVHGSLADQITIRAVLEKLDGSGRKFHVVPLRRLEADYVAGTVEFMMLGGGEDKQQPQSRRGYSDYYDRGNRDRQEVERDKFRVDADVENNRLLVWANDIEIAEVLNLLEKLGEISDRREGGGAGANLRVLPVEPGKDPRELLDRIQRLWPQLSPNPLVVPELPKAAEPQEKPPGNSAEELSRPSRGKTVVPLKAGPKSAPVERDTRRTAPWQPYIRVAQLKTTDGPASQPPAAEVVEAQRSEAEGADEPPGDERPSTPTPTRSPNETPAPVRISIAPDGRWVLSSTDTAALDQMEQLLSEVATPRKDFQVFHIKYAKAYWVKVNIEEFFQEEEKDSGSSRSRNYFFFDSPPPQKSEPRRRLSKRKPLRFISDPDTNTILVTGADPSQLKIISDLIELYDQPEPTDSKSTRVTTVYQVRWSKATVLADTVKDVYRDLLSSNDKALGTSPDQKDRSQQQTTYMLGEGGDKKTLVSFKGKLSIGIDDLSNTLLLSADGETLLNNVLKLVEGLDEAARPTSTVQVLKVEGGVNSVAVRKALTAILDDESKKENATPPAQSPSGASDSRRRSRSP